jgi:hypothetical protein
MNYHSNPHNFTSHHRIFERNPLPSSLYIHTRCYPLILQFKFTISKLESTQLWVALPPPVVWLCPAVIGTRTIWQCDFCLNWGLPTILFLLQLLYNTSHTVIILMCSYSGPDTPNYSYEYNTRIARRRKVTLTTIRCSLTFATFLELQTTFAILHKSFSIVFTIKTQTVFILQQKA